MYAAFNRFEIRLTRAQAMSASHPGPCDADVERLVRDASVAEQLAAIAPDKIRAELREYGSWSEAELADDAQNQRRIVWLAAGNIDDEARELERQWNEGARIADDCFCHLCGARGYQHTCPSCDRGLFGRG